MNTMYNGYQNIIEQRELAGVCFVLFSGASPLFVCLFLFVCEEMQLLLLYTINYNKRLGDRKSFTLFL